MVLRHGLPNTVIHTTSLEHKKKEDRNHMMEGIGRLCNVLLVALLSTAVSLSAEPLPQNPQEPVQTESQRPVDDSQSAQPTSPSSGNSAHAVSGELPDAPTPAQPVQQQQEDAGQAQNPSSVPSGAAGASSSCEGSPASRPVGSAIAPAK
jgi:hypothetical protein